MNSYQNFSDLGPEERLKIIWRFIEQRIPILLLGPAGSGKSYMGFRIMRKFIETYLDPDTRIVSLREIDELETGSLGEIKALYVSGSANVTKLDLLGGRTLYKGEYVRRTGILQKMMKNGGIIFLDEVTSLPPQFTILLNEIIDNIYKGTAHENFYIFFAGNPSYYLGANELPDALLERLTLIWFDHYPLEVEVEIVIKMIKNKKLRINCDSEEFEVFVRYIVSLLRMIRKTLQKEQENIPISVRSMYLAVLNTLNHRNKGSIEIKDKDKTAIYYILKGKTPENLTEVAEDQQVEKLIKFMRENRINWNHIKAGIQSLGILSKVTRNELLDEIISLIPSKNKK